MKPRTHTCKAVGCQRVIGRGMLMCAEHWSLVPSSMRAAVMQARYRDAAGEPGAWGDYRDAADRAVAAVKEKQERKAAAKAGPSGSLFT